MQTDAHKWSNLLKQRLHRHPSLFCWEWEHLELLVRRASSMHAKKQWLTLDTLTSHFRHILLAKACGKFKAKPLKTDNLFFSSYLHRFLQKQNVQRIKSDTKKNMEDKSLIKTSSYDLNFIDGWQLFCISATFFVVWEEQHTVALLTVGKPVNLWMTHGCSVTVYSLLLC